jgi:hypothetical protein
MSDRIEFVAEGPGDPEVALLERAPSVAGYHYQSAEMVRGVNHLRNLGREKCLAALRRYLAAGGEHDKVLVLCRLLFVNPKGWEPLHPGKPEPLVQAEGRKHFPLFRVALSDGVPFLLVDGFAYRGPPILADGCLKQCEGLSLVGEDYPASGHERAARALVQSGPFRKLYPARVVRQAEEMVLEQATAPKSSKK